MKSPQDTALKLLAYCQANDWAGYDPYDALNSRIFQALPFLDTRIPRLLLTQALKRSPVNIRPLLLIPKTQNPKALALFLSSLLKLFRSGMLKDEGLVDQMAAKIVALRSPNTPFWAWGYSFPWQTRTIVVPRGAPNIVCTIFVANSLLDAFDASKDQRFLSMAVSAAEYILTLLWTDGQQVASFSYPLPSARSRIHNANFLGAALLCRVSKHSGEKRFLEPAFKVARYSASKQRGDGSWDYGELPTQRWVDNFHTGYNLSGLRGISEYAETNEFAGAIERGFEFYRTHFFTDQGAPRYFHNSTYPIDAHCVAQSIITLMEFRHLDAGSAVQARSVFEWAMEHMWDERGFFYYRVLRGLRIKTSYMRWVQAWMLLALSTLSEAPEHPRTQAPGALLQQGSPA